MSIAYIRQYYTERAKVRRIVSYRGERCKIVGTRICYLLLRIINRKYRTMIVHPLDDDLDYLDGETK